MTTASVAQRFSRAGGIFALWFGVLAPAVIWHLRLWLSYILVPFACGTGSELPLHLVTLVTLLGTLFAGGVAWRCWRRTGATAAIESGGVLARSRFLAMFGLLSSGFFSLVILAEGVGNFFIDPCLTGGRPIGS